MTTATALSPAGTRRKGFRTLTLIQAKLLFREPPAVFWIALPLVLLIIFGSIPSFHDRQHALGGLRLIDVYVPTVAAMLPLFLGCTAMPVTMANLREKNVLRRFAVSPVPASGVLGSVLIVTAALAAVGIGLIIAVGSLVYHAQAPHNVGAVIASFILGSTAVFAIGLVLSAVARTGGMASALGIPVMVVNFFFSGLYVPVAQLPHALKVVGEFIPFGAVMDAWSGYGALWQHLLVLAAYTILGGLLAARLFRWE